MGKLVIAGGVVGKLISTETIDGNEMATVEIEHTYLVQFPIEDVKDYVIEDNIN